MTGVQGRERDPGQDRIWFVHAARGFAAAVVVWFHLGVLFVVRHEGIAEISYARPLSPAPEPFWARPFRVLHDLGLNLGSFGVALFFLVSGFVIPFSLRRISVGRFFLRRAIRIYPLYWLSLALLTAVLTFQSHRLGASFPFSRTAVVTNALLINGYLGQPTIDHINWTLAIEELFYAVCAAMTYFGLLGRPWGLISVALAASVVSHLFRGALPGLSGSIANGVAMNASFLPYLFMGTAIFQKYRGDWSTRDTIIVLGLLGMMFCENAHKGATAIMGLRSTCISYGGAFGAFVLLYASRARFRYSRWVDWLAKISYPLYLVHGINGYVLLFLLSPLLGSHVLAVLVAIVLVFLAASLLHSTVEAPLLELGKRLTAVKPVTAAAIARDPARP